MQVVLFGKRKISQKWLKNTAVPFLKLCVARMRYELRDWEIQGAYMTESCRIPTGEDTQPRATCIETVARGQCLLSLGRCTQVPLLAHLHVEKEQLCRSKSSGSIMSTLWRKYCMVEHFQRYAFYRAKKQELWRTVGSPFKFTRVINISAKLYDNFASSRKWSVEQNKESRGRMDMGYQFMQLMDPIPRNCCFLGGEASQWAHI